MIFPDKPRPAWQKPKPVVQTLPVPEPRQPKAAVKRPQGYYRERIEFLLITVGFYFWVMYWIQFK